LIKIITKFAGSGWDLIDVPSKAWLPAFNGNRLSNNIKAELIKAVEQADKECVSCGCEFDPLYKRVLGFSGPVGESPKILHLWPFWGDLPEQLYALLGSTRSRMSRISRSLRPVSNDGFPFGERDLYSPSLVTPSSLAI
jgi:hypothetical protein